MKGLRPLHSCLSLLAHDINNHKTDAPQGAPVFHMLFRFTGDQSSTFPATTASKSASIAFSGGAVISETATMHRLEKRNAGSSS